MDFQQKEIILFNILSRKHLIPIDGSWYVYVQPSIQLKHQAEAYYADLEYELSFADWLSQEETETVLVNLGLWDTSFHTRIQQLENQIDEIKVSLFHAAFKKDERNRLKRSLDHARKSLEKLEERLRILEHVTKEHFLQTLKLQYIIAMSIYDSKDEAVYTQDTLDESDNYILNTILNYLGENRLNHSVLRELARTEPWRSYWNIAKEKVFNVAVSDLTDEQRALALFSRMYDNAYQHPECPDDEIIEDDDAFDGWMIIQDKERKRNLAQKNVENLMGSKSKGATEIFIPVDNAEDAKRVRNMNDLEAQMDLKIREKVIEKHGKVEETNLPDIQRKLKQQAVRDFTAKVKKG